MNDFNKIELPEDVLAKMWRKIDFEEAQRNIFKLQQQLTLAIFKNNKYEKERLIKKITTSIDARVLAVKKVTDTNSAPGVDGIRWIKDSDKMKAVLNLKAKGYKAKPYRRFVVTEQTSQKQRHISIPAINDRAMQVLFSYALEPISEATADRKSFAFRKERSALDVHALIMHALNEHNAPTWVLVCDVKSYYYNISHNWLLKNIPMDKKVLKEFLKAGFIFDGELFPTDKGISLGCNISTIIANMALDGIQKLLYDLQNQKEIDYYEGFCIRFADDILIFSKKETKARIYLKIIKKFLKKRGLELSFEKTYINKIEKGFDFLSRHYYKENNTIHCIPSKKAIQKFESELYDLILEKKSRWSQPKLIKTLNTKLIGWAGYHRVEEAKEAFVHIDVVVSALLLRLMQKMYPSKPRRYLIEKFWYKDEYDREVFTLTTDKSIKVIKLADVILVKHKKLDIKKNVFLDTNYFKEKKKIQNINKVTDKYKNIWNRQNGRCYYCGNKITTNQPRKLVIRDLTWDNNTTRNMAYIHTFCEDDEIIFTNSNLGDLDRVDIKGILNEIEGFDLGYGKKYKYQKLYDYFSNCKKYTFLLKFTDIEDILDKRLCDSAYKYKSFWYQKKHGSISRCWIENNYSMKKLDFNKKSITFLREKKELTKIKIPEQLLMSNLPISAKYEMEKFFEYIIKKYGL